VSVWTGSVAIFLSLQLRAVVGDIPDLADKDDYYFLRWLRARGFNVRKAEDMIRKVNSGCMFIN